MVNVNVIYHRADYDGLFSGAAFLHALRVEVPALYGWDFVDKPVEEEHPSFDASLKTYIVDLPPSCFRALPRNVVWIDHHASAIANHDWRGLPGYRIDGVAACRLAWAWLNAESHDPIGGILPTKEEFVSRKVKEPECIRLAGEYDVWDKRDPAAEWFQYGLVAGGYDHIVHCQRLFHDPYGERVTDICRDGISIQAWQRKFAAQICAERGYMIEWENLHIWVLASAHCRSSSWFPDESVPADAEALLAWRFNGDQMDVSLYHRPGHEHFDLSRIAAKHGGGGHKGACGFRCPLDSDTGRAITREAARG